MQHPHLILNYKAMACAVVAAFCSGFVWYGPLFGKTWAKLMGMSGKKPSSNVMNRALLLQLLGTCLTVYVLAHSTQVWRPSVWKAGPDCSNTAYGFYSGFFTWLGFYLPMQFSKVAWENKSWKLFLINAGHDFVVLQIIAHILSHWR